MKKFVKKKRRGTIAPILIFAVIAAFFFYLAEKQNSMAKNLLTTFGKITDSFERSSHSESQTGSKLSKSIYYTVTFSTEKGEFEVKESASTVNYHKSAEGVRVVYYRNDPNHSWVGAYPKRRSLIYKVIAILFVVLASVYIVLFLKRTYWIYKHTRTRDSEEKVRDIPQDYNNKIY